MRDDTEQPFDGDDTAPTYSGNALGRFARVPYGAIRDERISFATLRVLVAFAERADSSGSSYPSVRTIAEDSGCTRRTVQRAIRRLEKAGYLSTIPGGMVRGRRRATRYTLVFRPDPRPKRRASS